MINYTVDRVNSVMSSAINYLQSLENTEIHSLCVLMIERYFLHIYENLHNRYEPRDMNTSVTVYLL